jgi:crotonobetainyl-CoA:carnitine CoA-transferase CaiB-like acyl-CoA transferase
VPPLSDVSVLDLSIWRPGPYATSLLVHLGADVLKVEPPGGDPMRHYGGLFESINAGKRSIVLDLKDPAHRSRALELAAEADVVVEGFRPGVMARLGLDEGAVRAVNQQVVYCSISGYGQQGPRSQLPGHDINYQAWAGALAPQGGPASLPPLPVADLASGLAAAFGICAALVERGAKGTGTSLDVSMTEVMSSWTGAVGPDDASERKSVPGYGLYTAADGGQVALGVVNEQHFWASLCHELGLEGESGIGFADRVRRSAELHALVAGSVATRTRDELVAALCAAGVPAAPVLDRPAMVASAPFPEFPVRMSPRPPGDTTPAPTMDEHRGQGFRKMA